jgi:hypothetical protein
VQELVAVKLMESNDGGFRTFLLRHWCVFDVYGVTKKLDAVFKQCVELVCLR